MLPLTRDVADRSVERLQEVIPVNVPNLLRINIHNALEIAKGKCEELILQDNPNSTEVDFWCDTMDKLKAIEFDISLVVERPVSGGG